MDVDAKKLLYLIEARSPIYNYKNKEHTNKMKIEKLWVEVATEMDCTVSECKTKWTNLRNSYTRYLRDERSKSSGSSNKPKKKWYLADAMAFVKSFINLHYSNSNISDSPEIDDVRDEISEADPLATLQENTQSHTSTTRNSPVPAKRSRTLVSEMVAGPMIEFLQSRTREKQPENANALFFKSMLADYEKLSSKRQRTFRLHMLHKMNELQEDDENEASNASTAAFSSEPMLNIHYDIKEDFSENCD